MNVKTDDGRKNGTKEEYGKKKNNGFGKETQVKKAKHEMAAENYHEDTDTRRRKRNTNESGNEINETTNEITDNQINELRKDSTNGNSNSNEQKNLRIRYKDADLQDIEIMDIIGEGIELSEDVKSLGKLGPSFRIFPKMDKLTMQVAIEKDKTKTRWGNNNKDSAAPTPIYNNITKYLDLGLLKSTDLNCNSDVIMPDPTSNKLEKDMDNVTTVFNEETKIFMNELKKRGTNPELANLTAQQIRGIEELCAMEDVVLGQSDKSKKMVVMSKEMYERLMDQHIKPEEEISETQLRELENKNNGVCKGNMKVFGVGQNSYKGKQIKRIGESLNSTHRTGARMGITVKDHKAREENGDPKTRPLSNCIGSMSEKSNRNTSYHS